ncbi:hypothetical protein IQ266_20965, partial [filamentous cyanobacterium LEGE 11480]
MQSLFYYVVQIDRAEYSRAAKVTRDLTGEAGLALLKSITQEAIDVGLKAVGTTRAQSVRSTRGDDAIIFFEDAASAHRFAQAVHGHTQAANQDKQAAAKCWFRIGCAYGELTFMHNQLEADPSGWVLAVVARLHQAGEPGEFLIDRDTYSALPPDLQQLYGAAESVKGKSHDTEFACRRWCVVPEAKQQIQPVNLRIMPHVRLPDNFVERPDALEAVKEKLLAEDDDQQSVPDQQTLVVSAIAGLGGLGKSVLATALVLDHEVQARFADGILWVTLGQNPDLLGLVGEWIRTLDKSRESFSATTMESASGYLHNLLAERRMLLVVDDVWNAAHAEWFRVGGAGCRVLVTTREAQIDGAEYYPLDLMTENEAIELVRGKLKTQWDESQAVAVKQFARVVGYLPLALDLSVNLVVDGLSWGELQAEFEAEQRAVDLELLNSTEALEDLPEGRQRKYSLRACFNLSLKRLQPEQLRRFAWLGVLPEDVRVDARMAQTLWDVPEVMAKRGLIELFRRSFLTSAGESVEGYPLYRVHDLMHDTARGLIENGELGVENLEKAHGAFVDRYGALDYGQKLCGLPKDGYIQRHLTWHL